MVVENTWPAKSIQQYRKDQIPTFLIGCLRSGPPRKRERKKTTSFSLQGALNIVSPSDQWLALYYSLLRVVVSDFSAR